ncbi:MAG: CbtB domain-containing protein [Aestuariivirgaceae bacterium]
MTTNQIALQQVSIKQRVIAGLVCMTLGLGMIVGVGFAGAHTMHNAAHDTRHAVGFPCH